jgi:Cu(I)/Ag(I) efflux system protein CusF
MTMAFVATPPALLRNLRVGQGIDFTVQMRGTTAAVTAIRPR